MHNESVKARAAQSQHYVILRYEAGFYEYNGGNNELLDLLGCFLAYDVERDADKYREWIDHPVYQVACGNFTALDKEADTIILRDLTADEETAPQLTVSIEQLKQLLDEWQKKIYANLPTHVLITSEQGTFSLEGIE